MSKQPPPEVTKRLRIHWHRLCHREAARAVIFAAHGVPVKRIKVRYRKSLLGDTWSIRGHMDYTGGPPYDHPYTMAVAHAAAAMGVAYWANRGEGLTDRQARVAGLDACSRADLLAIYRWRSKVRPRISKRRLLDDALLLVKGNWSKILRLADTLDQRQELGGKVLRDLL